MDVQCEKCGTEYALDETLVGPSGTAVRCTSCGHVFKVFATAKPAGARETWMLRQASGATFPFDRLGVLQEWISAGKVSEDDLIAKSGGEWKRLGDIAEMRPFFDALKSTQQSMPSPSAPAAGYQSMPPSEMDKTIRAPAGGVTPSAPPQGGPGGPTTAQYGSPQPDAFAATQVGTPAAQPVSTNQPGAPTVQATAPTIQAHSPSIDPQTAATQPQMPQVQPGAPTVQAQLPPGVGPAPGPPQDPSAGATQPQMPAAQPRAGVETAPTRPLKPVPDSSAPPPAAAPSQPEDAATVMLPADDPRYSKTGPQTDAPDGAARTVMSEPDFSESQIPAQDEGRWERGAGVQAEGPAWAERGGKIADEADDYDDELPERKRGPGKWIALVIIVLLVGGGFYMFLFQRPIVDDLLASVIGSGDTERHEKFFLSGQEQFLLDTFPAFKQADREYQKVLALSENDARTLAALAEMYAVWAQYLRDSSIDARADALAAAAEGAEPDLREAERLESELEEKLAEAKRWAEQAIGTDPDLAAARVAMADVKRLSGDLDGARNELERTRGTAAGAPVDYVTAMVAIDEGGEPADSVATLEGVIKLEELLRALYRRGRVLAASGDGGGAKQALARLTELNSQHGLARDLSERIGADKPVFLTRSALDAHFSVPAGGAGAPDGGVDTDSAPAKEEPEPPTKVATPAGGGGGTEGGFVPTGGSPDALLARAAKLQQSGNSSGAATLFQKVLESQPSNIDALCGLAYCYLDRGNKGQAVAHFRRALGVNASYGPAIIGLANTYKSQGNKSEALKWYKKYLQVRPGGRHATLAKANIERLEGELGKGGGEATTGDTGGDKPAADTGGDKPASDAPDKPDDPPASDPPAGGSTGGSSAPVTDPHSLPAPKDQQPATEG